MAEVRELAGCVLLKNYNYDLEAFRVQFYDDWKVEIDRDPNPFNYEFDLGDAHVAILVIPMKKEGAEDGCAMNYEWENSRAAVEQHKAHVEVGILNCEEPIRRFILFSMVASSLMKQDNVIGLYRYPKTWRAQDFIDQAEVLKKEDLPIGEWVFVGVHRDEQDRWNCYTYGMEDFGCEEMEILHTEAGLLDMYQFMQQLVKWLIQANETLDPSQRLRTADGDSCTITRSDATVFEGLSLKIGYKIGALPQ